MTVDLDSNSTLKESRNSERGKEDTDEKNGECQRNEFKIRHCGQPIAFQRWKGGLREQDKFKSKPNDYRENHGKWESLQTSIHVLKLPQVEDL